MCLAATPIALVGPGAAAGAAGNVSRYQVETLTISATLHAYVTTNHTYTVTLNPCTDTFSGTGAVQVGTNWLPIETITGTYDGSSLSFYASYTSGSVAYGISDVAVSSGSFAGTGYRDYFPGTEPWPVTGTVTVTATTDYANHGAYVSADPGADAAHSCVGMPIAH
ncbi:MAG: hypothetical protein B7Z69_03580 [Actinobacteria bacterium 21-73-9]|nr:MAG: hypothetical protein B7Z69_03580 [Actinobacteria bacterium 21-73-9]